jgi:hypothetical protein
MLRSVEWYLTDVSGQPGSGYLKHQSGRHSECTVLTVTSSTVNTFSLFRRCLIVLNTLKFAKSLRKLQKTTNALPKATWQMAITTLIKGRHVCLLSCSLCIITRTQGHA